MNPREDRRYVRFVWTVMFVRLCFELVGVAIIASLVSPLNRWSLAMAAVLGLGWIMVCLMNGRSRLRSDHKALDNYAYWMKSQRNGWFYFQAVLGW